MTHPPFATLVAFIVALEVARSCMVPAAEQTVAVPMRDGTAIETHVKTPTVTGLWPAVAGMPALAAPFLASSSFGWSLVQRDRARRRVRPRLRPAGLPVPGQVRGQMHEHDDHDFGAQSADAPGYVLDQRALQIRE